MYEITIKKTEKYQRLVPADSTAGKAPEEAEREVVILVAKVNDLEGAQAVIAALDKSSKPPHA